MNLGYHKIIMDIQKILDIQKCILGYPQIDFLDIHNSFLDIQKYIKIHFWTGERGGSVVECRTPEREVGGSKPTAAVLCP